MATTITCSVRARAHRAHLWLSMTTVGALLAGVASCEQPADDENEPPPQQSCTSNCSDPCTPDPCQNGGQCMPSDTGYSCTCPSDVEGEHCEIDCRRPSLTYDMWGLQAGPVDASSWMFDSDMTPFVQNGMSVYAYGALSWNEDGVGDGSCAGALGDGSGVATTAQVTAEDSDALDGVQGLTIELVSPLTLTTFQHLNTYGHTNWDTLGEAGDFRVYGGGVVELRQNGDLLLTIDEVSIDLMTYYPAPLGTGGATGAAAGRGYGTVDAAASSATFLASIGVEDGSAIDFFFGSFSPVLQNCYGSFDTEDIVVRPRPSAAVCNDEPDSDGDGLIDLYDDDAR